MMNSMITKMIKKWKKLFWPGPVCGCKFFIRLQEGYAGDGGDEFEAGSQVAGIQSWAWSQKAEGLRLVWYKEIGEWCYPGILRCTTAHAVTARGKWKQMSELRGWMKLDDLKLLKPPSMAAGQALITQMIRDNAVKIPPQKITWPVVVQEGWHTVDAHGSTLMYVVYYAYSLRTS